MSAESKEDVRARFKARRRKMAGLGSSTASRLSAAAAPLLESLPEKSSVACYLSAGTEPDTSALLAALDAAGHTVLVPVCEPERQLSWCPWTPATELAPGLFPAIPEPVGPRLGAEEVLDLDLLLIPALAVDASGTRMGKGGGYYDRFLAQFRAGGGSAPAVAVVHDHEFLPEGGLPADPLDAPVDGVLTPAGFTPVRGTGVYT